jgi:hypothetical protein
MQYLVPQAFVWRAIVYENCILLHARDHQGRLGENYLCSGLGLPFIVLTGGVLHNVVDHDATRSRTLIIALTSGGAYRDPKFGLAKPARIGRTISGFPW